MAESFVGVKKKRGLLFGGLLIPFGGGELPGQDMYTLVRFGGFPGWTGGIKRAARTRSSDG